MAKWLQGKFSSYHILLKEVVYDPMHTNLFFKVPLSVLLVNVCINGSFYVFSFLSPAILSSKGQFCKSLLLCLFPENLETLWSLRMELDSKRQHHRAMPKAL